MKTQWLDKQRKTLAQLIEFAVITGLGVNKILSRMNWTINDLDSYVSGKSKLQISHIVKMCEIMEVDFQFIYNKDQSHNEENLIVRLS